jgi:uncharacterized RDD family membrane protein YckC
MHFFNRITHQTPESVELEFTLAGIGSRAWALLIDYHILTFLIVGFLLIWSFIAYQVVELWNQIFRNTDVGLWMLAIAFLVTFFLYTGYFVLFETLWQGQTPGKRFAKIRVVRDDGRPIGIQQAVLRSLLRPFDDILFIGAFLIMFSQREKRLGDLVAGTIVIQTETPHTSANFPVSDSAYELMSQLLQSEADFSQLLPDDFAVIREYLQRRKAMSKQAKEKLSLELAKQTKRIIALEKLPQAVKPDTFLEAVYLAYQQERNENM